VKGARCRTSYKKAIILGFLGTGGFLFLIIPGIIFLVWFIFAQFIIFAEDDRGMNAILKSKEYVRGKWASIEFQIPAEQYSNARGIEMTLNRAAFG